MTAASEVATVCSQRPGSFGPGLTSLLLACGERVVEVDRSKRPARRNSAKSDVLDATRAAREVLAREPLAQPRPR